MKRRAGGTKPTAMPGFIKPQLATLRTKAPQQGGYLHEIKYDGYRVQLHLDQGRGRAYTRNGLDWTKRFSKIVAAFDIAGQAIVDGEVVVVHDGRTNFSELQADLARCSKSCSTATRSKRPRSIASTWKAKATRLIRACRKTQLRGHSNEEGRGARRQRAAEPVGQRRPHRERHAQHAGYFQHRLISLTTAGTNWGYLSSLAIFIPVLGANTISSTNISVTLSHYTPRAITSFAGGGGNYIVSSTSSVSASSAGSVKIAAGGTLALTIVSSGYGRIGTTNCDRGIVLQSGAIEQVCGALSPENEVRSSSAKGARGGRSSHWPLLKTKGL
jgi:hypothetical protein